MALPTHLVEGDFAKDFPEAVDEFPTVMQGQHYIDAWLLNTAFDSLLALETYLLEHRQNIEPAGGNDIIGDEGSLLIPIPAVRYPPYKFALAWDSNLLEENIKAGVTIFGITGTYGG